MELKLAVFRFDEGTVHRIQFSCMQPCCVRHKHIRHANTLKVKFIFQALQI